MFTLGDKVLAKFKEDGRWYPAIVKKVLQNGKHCIIKWVEGGAEEKVSENELMNPREVLQKDLCIQIIVPEDLNFYEDVIVQNLADDDSLTVYCEFPDVSIKPVPFEKIIVQDSHLRQWRNRKTAKRKSRSQSPLIVRDFPTAQDHALLAKDLMKGWSVLISIPEHCKPPPNRGLLVKRLQEMGTRICDTFDELRTSTGNHCLLVPLRCRSAKYLQCVAAGIPCIAFKWVREVYKLGCLSTWDHHLLSPKPSPDLNTPVSFTNADGVHFLQNQKIGLHGGWQFMDIYYTLLESVGANRRALEDADIRSKKKLSHFTLILVESSEVAFLDDLLANAQKAAVPVVDHRWIVESLYNGTVLPKDEFLIKST